MEIKYGAPSAFQKEMVYAQGMVVHGGKECRAVIAIHQGAPEGAAREKLAREFAAGNWFCNDENTISVNGKILSLPDWKEAPKKLPIIIPPAEPATTN